MPNQTSALQFKFGIWIQATFKLYLEFNAETDLN